MTLKPSRNFDPFIELFMESNLRAYNLVNTVAAVNMQNLDPVNSSYFPIILCSCSTNWCVFQTNFENADLFYRHALNHTESFPDGNAVKGGCKCLWEGRM